MQDYVDAVASLEKAKAKVMALMGGAKPPTIEHAPPPKDHPWRKQKRVRNTKNFSPNDPAPAIKEASCRDLCLAALKEAETEMTAGDLQVRTGKQLATVYNCLSDMVRDGSVVRTSPGKYKHAA